MPNFAKVVSASPGSLTVRGDDGQTYTVTGSRNLRNNNPGNIEAGAYANSMGAIGSDGRFAVFPNYQTGQAAQADLQFNSPSYSGLTIGQAINRYAPPSENNSAGYAAGVARAVGVPVNTPLSSLSPAQRQAYLTAQQGIEGGQPQAITTASGVTLPPADIPNADPGPVSPLPPPAWYGINASGSPDDRSLDPNYYPPSYTPVPLAPVQMNVSGSPDDRGSGLPFDASTPINVAPPAAPVVTAPSGNTYVAGDVYQTADGASFRANSDGSFTKVANTPRQVTPIQLLLDSQVPGAQQNLANTVNSIENVAQTAGSKAGDFFKSLFSSGAPATVAAPNSSGSPDDRGGAPFSYSAPVAMNSSGSPDDRDPDPSVGVTTWQSLLGVPTPSVGTTPIPGLPNPYSVSSGPFNYSGSPDDRQAAENAANSGARQTNSGIAGTVQLPSGVTPAGAASAEAQAVQANGGSRSSGPATSDDGGWSSLLTAVGDAPFSSPAPAITAPTSAPATTHGTDQSPAFTTKTEIEQVANPAYSAWLKDQNSAIYGVEGVDTPSLDASGNVVLPSSYAGATAPKVPAPPKTIAKPITVKIPVRATLPAAAPAPVKAPISPIASPNGYTYVPNGNGGYTRVGVVNPSLTPSQQYAQAAAPALASQPNGAAGMGSSNPNVNSNGSLV